MDEFTFESIIEELNRQTQNLDVAAINENYVEIQDYEKETHWSKMDLACELISKECTKMAVAFSKPPLPTLSETNLLIKDIAKAVDILLAWYNTFPMKEGKLLHKVLTQCVQSILSATSEFLNTHQDKTEVKSKQTKLVSTGSIWECCEKFKSLPKDNTNAVIDEMSKSYVLLSDVINEINETIKEEDQEILNSIDDDEYHPNRWTEADRKLITPCQGLLMASKGLLKKTKAALKLHQPSESNLIGITDHLMELYDDICPTVDDFMEHLYPPVDKENLATHVLKLTDLLQNILIYLRKSAVFGNDQNRKWIDFIDKAIAHNKENFNLVINAPVTY